MNRYRNMSDVIGAEIDRRLRYLKHYVGQVISNADSSSKGRVQVAVPELGWDSGNRAAWCWPRQGAWMQVPPVGAWVEIHFVGGDPNRPAYLPGAVEISGQLPPGYDGNMTTQVIYSDSKSNALIKYDASANVLTLGGGNGKNQIMINFQTGKIIIGDTSPAASARSGDATGIDLTTDATNLPMIIAVCAIFGMTVTPPLVGKITSGSAQVTVGA